MKAIDVANFFIDYNNHREESVILDNIKLNQLLYFSQGYHLALFNKPLFDEDIESREYGFIVPSVYDTYKENGNNNISSITGDYDYESIDSDELDTLLLVIEDNFEYNTEELVILTRETYRNKAGQSNIIPLESIKEYFKNDEDIDISRVNINIDHIESVGYHDKDGHLVLPADWDDGADYSCYLDNDKK